MSVGEKHTQPLRVIQACDLQAGGITSLILAVCAQLDRERVNFDYLVYRSQEEFGDKKIKELGGKKLTADNTDAPNKAAKFLWKFFRTWRILKEEQVQIFHINAPTPYDCLVGIAARLAGAKAVILHSHNSQLKKEGRGHRAFQGICRMLLPLCGDYYFACSDLAGDFLFGKKRRSKIFYVKNGISVEHFRFHEDVRRKMRAKYLRNEGPVIGSIGRFCKQKNQKFLLEIFADILKIDSDATLLLIGQGELEAELMDMAGKLSIRDNIIHITATDKVNEYLCMMDVFLLPSLFEGFPVVGVEAQACGLPCIFSDTITKEAALTDRACFMNIKHSAGEWAELAARASRQGPGNRASYADIVKEAGYDIKATARWLQEFYLKL